MNFLRTTSTGRLVAGLALAVAVIAGGVAVAGRRRRRRQSAPAEGAATSPSTTRSPRPKPDGRHGTHPLHEQPDLQRRRRPSALRCSRAPPDGSGSRTVACGSSCSRTPATRRSRSPTARLSIYDASSNTVYRAERRPGDSADGHGNSPTTARRASRRSRRRLSGWPSRRPSSGAQPDDAGRTARVQRHASRPSTTPGCSARPRSPGTRRDGIPLRIAVTRSWRAARRCSRSR